jgi:hypothetical protein
MDVTFMSLDAAAVVVLAVLAGSVRQVTGDVTEGQLADVTGVSRQDGHSRRAAPKWHSCSLKQL